MTLFCIESPLVMKSGSCMINGVIRGLLCYYSTRIQSLLVMKNELCMTNGSERSNRAGSPSLLKGQNSWKVDHGYSLVVGNWWHPLQLLKSCSDDYSRDILSANWRNVPASADIGQEKRLDPRTRQNPTPYFIDHHKKIERVSPSSIIIPDLSPTDSYLFICFENFPTNRTTSEKQSKTAFADFIKSRASNFYSDEINRFMSRSAQCAESDDAYLD